MKKIYLLMTGLLLAAPALAEVNPQATLTDEHVQVAIYNPSQVYRLSTLQGFITSIQFAPDEKVLSVNIGDSSSWLVSVQNNMINLKPTVGNPNTNLNVLTSRGTYQFLLTAPALIGDKDGKLSREPQKNTAFLVRFSYPQEKPNNMPALSAPKFKNWNYAARGNALVAPISVYDDGRFTYFNFGLRKDIPAIFSVDNKGNESIVNYHLQMQWVVVETTARQFTLRNGAQNASVFNESFQNS